VIQVAVTKDGNGNLFLLAFGIAPKENLESWGRFMEALHRSLPDANSHSVTFISDRDKGIEHAIRNHFPRANVAKCSEHLVRNLSTRGCSSVVDLVRRAAKVLCKNEFASIMAIVASISPRAADYLAAHENRPELWALSHARIRRFGITTSNNAESANALLKSIRCQPIGLLISSLYGLMMERHGKVVADLTMDRPTCLAPCLSISRHSQGLHNSAMKKPGKLSTLSK
jgi:hypothetical protein